MTAKTLKSAIREVVDKEAKIMTDDWEAYRGIDKEFKGGHEIVKHSEGEYIKGDVSTYGRIARGQP